VTHQASRRHRGTRGIRVHRCHMAMSATQAEAAHERHTRSSLSASLRRIFRRVPCLLHGGGVSSTSSCAGRPASSSSSQTFEEKVVLLVWRGSPFWKPQICAFPHAHGGPREMPVFMGLEYQESTGERGAWCHQPSGGRSAQHFPCHRVPGTYLEAKRASKASRPNYRVIMDQCRTYSGLE
jgi:hypothetical protein